MKELRVNTKNTSYDELLRVARRCRFVVFEGRKHCKIKTPEGMFVAAIPRHTHLKRETAKGIVEAMNNWGASINLN